VFQKGNNARQTAETAGDYQSVNGIGRRELTMLVFPVVSALFAALIVAAVLLWKAGASEPR
jgi:hypothetical protein